MKGHTIERCFKIIGYPENYKKKENSQIYNKRPANNNSVSKNSEVGPSVSSCPVSLPFTPEQMLVLKSLIKGKGPAEVVQANMARNSCGLSSWFNSNSFLYSSGSSPGWIIDSGANQHMTLSRKGLSNLVDVSDLNLIVGHPNGTNAKVMKIGNLKLSRNVTLFDVLVVPEYCVNLLSVHKLARDSKCFVGFDEFKCYIQDFSQKRIQGTGSEQGGLYFFDSKDNCKDLKCNSASVCLLSKHLWHSRLGHPADQALYVLKDKLRFGKESLLPCDICHKAKQTGEPFPLSDVQTKSLGDIVHLDIWGPYKVTSKEGYKYFFNYCG